MKIVAVLVVLLPLVMSAPGPRAGNPFLNSILNVFHADELKQLVFDLVQDLGSDNREQECEKECNKVVDIQFTGSINTITHATCPVVCHSMQELVHYFHIPTNPPKSTTTI